MFGKQRKPINYWFRWFWAESLWN